MKYINPIYDRLIDQINIGTQIALAQKDFDSVIVGFEYCDRIGAEQKKHIEKSILQYIKTSTPKVENILAYVAFVKNLVVQKDV